MSRWIERYCQQAEERYERLDAVLAEMQGEFARWVGPDGMDTRIVDWDATTARPSQPTWP